MRIEHIAVWVKDLELAKEFYEKYFSAKSNEKYINAKKQFSSYFLSFDNGSRLEIMSRPDIEISSNDENLGFIHLAFSVGSKELVDELTEKLRMDGYDILGEARTTGDGYYESVVADPEGNKIEITI